MRLRSSQLAYIFVVVTVPLTCNSIIKLNFSSVLARGCIMAAILASVMIGDADEVVVDRLRVVGYSLYIWAHI